MESRIFFSKLSTMVKTKIMAKIPIVMPNKLRNERNLLPTNACQAANTLSLNKFMITFGTIAGMKLQLKIRIKDAYQLLI